LLKVLIDTKSANEKPKINSDLGSYIFFVRTEGHTISQYTVLPALSNQQRIFADLTQYGVAVLKNRGDFGDCFLRNDASYKAGNMLHLSEYLRQTGVNFK